MTIKIQAEWTHKNKNDVIICLYLNIWFHTFKYRIFNCCKSIKYILLFTYALWPNDRKLLQNLNHCIIIHLHTCALIWFLLLTSLDKIPCSWFDWALVRPSSNLKVFLASTKVFLDIRYIFGYLRYFQVKVNLLSDILDPTSFD